METKSLKQKILEVLADGPLSTSEIATALDGELTRKQVMDHLSHLHRAGRLSRGSDNGESVYALQDPAGRVVVVATTVDSPVAKKTAPAAPKPEIEPVGQDIQEAILPGIAIQGKDILAPVEKVQVTSKPDKDFTVAMTPDGRAVLIEGCYARVFSVQETAALRELLA